MSTTRQTPRGEAFENTIREASDAMNSGAYDYGLSRLERAHVLGQTRVRRHLRVHVLMLVIAWRRRDIQECLAQCLRIVLVPIGHLTGRIPPGNPGTGRVSAFASMPIDPNLAELLRADETS